MSMQTYTSKQAVHPTSDGLVTQKVVATDSTVARSARVQQIINLLTSLLLALLGTRFVLSLLGANRNNSFAGLVYELTHPLVSPFAGLFGYQIQYGMARFEIETLIAMAVYALIGYGIARLVSIGRLY